LKEQDGILGVVLAFLPNVLGNFSEIVKDILQGDPANRKREQ